MNDWTQRVVISGKKFSWRQVTSGVPRGSLRYSNIFINDLENEAESTLSKFMVHKDDQSSIWERVLQTGYVESSIWISRWGEKFWPCPSQWELVFKSLLRSGASSRFLCSPHHTPLPASQVCKFLLVQIFCLSQTIISRQRLFRFYCHKECEERSTVKKKVLPALICIRTCYSDQGTLSLC